MDRMAGGVERMIVTLMNAMDASGHEVALFSWDRADAAAFYPMAPGIDWHRLDMGDPGSKAGMGLIAARAPIVRRLVRRLAPDAIVCFQGGPFMAMALYTAGLGIPLVAAQRTAPTLYEHASNARHRFVEYQALRFAACITIQFERFRALYPAHLRARLVTIPNPVATATIQAKPEAVAPGKRFRLLSIGRLTYQKNYGVLLNAFAALAPRFPDWELRIIGEGENRQALEAQLARLPGLGARVSMPGTSTDVAAEYGAAQLFCLPSLWEGFPNALAEALAHGLPAVGFEGCAGVPDLIESGRNGVLASGNDDAQALAAALGPLMADPRRRAEMGLRGVESVAPYRPEAIFELWDGMLRACATR
jgi:glycosyltransferase involved in cell wall biosynthesis